MRPGKGEPRGRRRGAAGKLVLALVTCVNLALSVLLAVMRRQETLKALREEDGSLVLLRAQKETKTGKKP